VLAKEYFDFQERLSSRGLMFSFTGYVSEGILFALGEALKQKIAVDVKDQNVTKKVFSVFVEQVQNIIRYSADRVTSAPGEAPVELSSGVIAVGQESAKFFVVCGNVVSTDDTTRLRQRLEHLKQAGEAVQPAHK